MSKPKNVVCKNCENGRHRTTSPRCGLDMCSCWCLLGESVPFIPPVRRPEWRHEDLTPTLDLLRAHSVVCKAKDDGTLLWKPRPSELPPEVAEVIREKKLLLACVLVPDRVPTLRQRHYWMHGGAVQCDSCSKLTILRNPLGTPRHHHCGWLRQVRYH